MRQNQCLSNLFYCLLDILREIATLYCHMNIVVSVNSAITLFLDLVTYSH